MISYHSRRRVLRATAIALSSLTLPALPALAQGTGDPVRKIVLITDTQGAVPQAYQAAQLIAQAWKQLGLDVEARPMARQAQTDLVWFNRDKWDTTMWRMVGRPERSDPDEPRAGSTLWGTTARNSTRWRSNSARRWTPPRARS
jgi:peptide/nickel transport system substrate-binding protein